MELLLELRRQRRQQLLKLRHCGRHTVVRRLTDYDQIPANSPRSPPGYRPGSHAPWLCVVRLARSAGSLLRASPILGRARNAPPLYGSRTRPRSGELSRAATDDSIRTDDTFGTGASGPDRLGRTAPAALARVPAVRRRVRLREPATEPTDLKRHAVRVTPKSDGQLALQSTADRGFEQTVARVEACIRPTHEQHERVAIELHRAS